MIRSLFVLLFVVVLISGCSYESSHPYNKSIGEDGYVYTRDDISNTPYPLNSSDMEEHRYTSGRYDGSSRPEIITHQRNNNNFVVFKLSNSSGHTVSVSVDDPFNLTWVYVNMSGDCVQVASRSYNCSLNDEVSE